MQRAADPQKAPAGRGVLVRPLRHRRARAPNRQMGQAARRARSIHRPSLYRNFRAGVKEEQRCQSKGAKG
eukprot:8839438-Alexandrium_andersonii.AAC.1